MNTKFILMLVCSGAYVAALSAMSNDIPNAFCVKKLKGGLKPFRCNWIDDPSFAAAVLRNDRLRTMHLASQESTKKSIDPFNAPKLFIAACRQANVVAARYLKDQFQVDPNCPLCEDATDVERFQVAPLFVVLKWGCYGTHEERDRQKAMVQFLLECKGDINQVGFYSKYLYGYEDITATPLMVAVHKYDQAWNHYQQAQRYYAHDFDAKYHVYPPHVSSEQPKASAIVPKKYCTLEQVNHWGYIVQQLLQHGAVVTHKDVHQLIPHTSDPRMQKMLNYYDAKQRNDAVLLDEFDSSPKM